MQNIESEHCKEYRGHKIKISVHTDCDFGAPWEENDGHGSVSDWTRRDKAPGERVLCEDRGSKRFYDFAGAMAIAKRDGWGLNDADKAKLAAKLGRAVTPGDIRAEAVERDFNYLRGWCNDDWHWVGFTTAIETPEGKTVDGESVWGYDDADYMIQEAFSQAEATIDGLILVAEQTAIAECVP